MRARSGQAIVEFVVGLVAILILTAALLQIGTLVREDTHTLQEARAGAGMAALDTRYLAPVSPGPRYIQDWTEGPDGAAYTRDDQPVIGNSDMLASGIIGYARPGELRRRLPGNPMSDMADSSAVLHGLSFVHGHDESEPVILLPIARKLIFGRDTISMESDTYLIWTKGLE